MEDTVTFENGTGIPFSSLDWLSLHHAAKHDIRLDIVQAAPIQDGDRIVDVACGPGLWTAMLAKRVGPAGQVVGLDRDPDLLEAARYHCADSGCGDRATFRRGDMLAMPFEDDTFDGAFFANSLSFIEDPVAAIREVARVTRPGGHVVVKHYDETFLWAHPLPRPLLARLLTAREKRFAAEGLSGLMDHGIGSRLPALMRAAGLEVVSTQAFPALATAPLTAAQKDFYARDMLSVGREAEGYADPADIAAYMRAFDPHSPDCILDDPSLLILQMDFLTVGRPSGGHSD